MFQASIRNCLNCVHNCDDHSSLEYVQLRLFLLCVTFICTLFLGVLSYGIKWGTHFLIFFAHITRVFFLVVFRIWRSTYIVTVTVDFVCLSGVVRVLFQLLYDWLMRSK